MNSLQKRVQTEEREVARLEGVVGQWEAESATKRAELADLESRIGDEVLADESAADGLTDTAARLRSRIELANRTAEAAGRKLQAARGGLALAQAAEKRDRAGKLRAQAVAHEAKVDAVAEQLRALDPTAVIELGRPTADERRKVRADAKILSFAASMLEDLPPFLQLHHEADVLLEEAESLEQSAAGIEPTSSEPAARQLAH
jgi:hypothetical protein